MEDCIAISDGRANARGIPNVSRKDLDTLEEGILECIQPSPGVERVVIHKSSDGMAAAGQGLDQVASNEAIGTGDENTASVS